MRSNKKPTTLKFKMECVLGPWTKLEWNRDHTERHRVLKMIGVEIGRLTEFKCDEDHMWGAGRYYEFRLNVEHEHSRGVFRTQAAALKPLIRRKRK